MIAEKSKEIKKALIDKDLTQQQIANEMNLSKYTINQVINGSRKSKRVEQYLNARLGLKEVCNG